ncbi:transcriptional regulator [Saccharomonospora sp. CUA-673]|uniref:LysR family transcriptional regulator n=1 Tax=Saccharomonospora sp. CUA-673 TaxID=1904969 RepID=UPI0009656F94|nr:LysR family transcriptional regulator [Saccharomonospora sp. CUA-673]OLT42652.1 transcriptional regulator [Saccharomonospora sp. CUA-673]
MGIDLSLRQLRVVVAVADARGYSAAARKLHIAQSSLSRVVLEVEHHVGAVLFERTTRHVTPTADGVEFLRIARRLLADVEAAFHHFEGYLAGTRGAVTVAALPSLAASMVPTVLAELRRTLPDVAVTVRDGLSDEVLDRVVDGTADLAVTVSPTVPDGLTATTIAVDRFVCVFPPGHRFDTRKRLTWKDLAGEPFVAFDHSTSIRPYVDRTLAEAGVELGPITEARNIGAVAGLTAAGLGLSMVPALVVPMMGFAGLHRRVATGPVVERDICLVHDPRRPMSRPARALLDTLSAAAAQELPLPVGARWIPRH